MAKLLQALGRSAPYVEVMPAPVLAERAPASSDTRYPVGQPWVDQSVTPNILYFHIGGGDWNSNELTLSTDATFASASDSTASSSLAIKTYVDGVAIAGAPDATEVTKGIAELANTAEAEAGTDDERIMTALKTTQLLDSGNHSASLTDLDVSGTMTFTGALDVDTTGAISLDADAASNFSVAGAGIDLTLASAAGRVVINGEEAAADAIRLLSAAGGLDANLALQVNIATSQSAADAMVLEATAGGIDILASGAAAGEDIDISATGSSVNISSSENVADAIVLNASAGGIDITAAGAAGEDIDIVNTAGSIIINAGEAVTDAINVDSAGGFDLDAVGQVNIASSQNAADAIVLIASAGGVDITATGAAGEDLDLLASGSSVNVTATEDDAGAIYIRANGGTSERVRLHSDQGTGVDSVFLESDVGGITLQSGLASADAINLSATAGGLDLDGALQVNIASSQAAVANSVRIVASAADGGVDIDSGTGGMTLDSTGALSLDAAAASNFSVSGAGVDLTLASAAGRVIVNAGEDAADAIYLHADAGTSETIRLHSDQGTGAASIHLESDVGGVTLTSGLASADAINLNSSAGGVDIDGALQVNIASSQAAADAISFVASDAAGGIQFSAGSNGVDITDANLKLSGAATQLQVEGGAATDFIGTATLSSGTVTVNNTNIAATDRIFIQRQSINGSSALGSLTYSISAATSFSITAVQDGTPASTETNDNSIVMYFIVRQL